MRNLMQCVPGAYLTDIQVIGSPVVALALPTVMDLRLMRLIHTPMNTTGWRPYEIENFDPTVNVFNRGLLPFELDSKVR